LAGDEELDEAGFFSFRGRIDWLSHGDETAGFPEIV